MLVYLYTLCLQDNPEPGTAFKIELADCVKSADFERAYAIFEKYMMAGVPATGHIYSLLFNIAARATRVPPSTVSAAWTVYQDMAGRGVPMSEAVYASLIRICSIGGDVGRAQELLAHMKERGLEPRLRSYSPILFACAHAGRAEGAAAIAREMEGAKLVFTQIEYAALLRAFALAGDHEGVQSVLCRIAESVPHCDSLLAGEMREYFTGGTEAARARLAQGKEIEPPEAWHSVSGIPVTKWATSSSSGSGSAGAASSSSPPPIVSPWPWRVLSSTVDPSSATCAATGKAMPSVDISLEAKKELMQQCVSLLATAKQKAMFAHFQDFIARHGPFDVIVDGANVGFNNQNFSDGAFSYTQVDAVVKAFARKGYKVLLVLHKRWLQDNVVADGEARRTVKKRVNHYAARARGEVDGETGKVMEGPASGDTKPQLWRPGGSSSSSSREDAQEEGQEGVGGGASASPGQEEGEDRGDDDSYDSAEERGDFGAEEAIPADSPAVEWAYGGAGMSPTRAAAVRAAGGDPTIAWTAEQDSEAAPGVVAGWKAEKDCMLFSVPVGFNDDWFWLYASLASQVMKEEGRVGDKYVPQQATAGAGSEGSSSSSSVVERSPLDSLPAALSSVPPAHQPVWLLSNDFMRDHHWQMLHVAAMTVWRDRHQVHMKVQAAVDAVSKSRYRACQLTFPLPYSHIIHRMGDGSSWHVPLGPPPARDPHGKEEQQGRLEKGEWLVATRTDMLQGGAGSPGNSTKLMQ